ncbi:MULTISPECIES: choline ABC transporter substrate-binding protein [Sinorhizobium]|uniref:choline ABC transporter substrate-binding protein n=1 Tax=Sinorhizobium TaxID=28105 RepID=UPI000BEACF24|nr:MULTISPECIES: choline ABC transporter substrate-binding protein [Sinorhizobium]PDT50067.1 glycine/betaine ABC transporter substrate-binding protein [Sinorhizobium sp. NG07B]POH33715.1 glycine/betaine ABC transporter substrate-binding protein [Sinorhizobium americanum]
MKLSAVRGLFAAFVLLVGNGEGASAAEDESCRVIRMSDPGWTDITSTNAVASVLLDALGYETAIMTLSVPIGYQAMKNKEVDVFLGNWMPAQQAFIDDLRKANAIEVLARNLEGAKFTLAVPSYVAKRGIKDLADLQAHADEFDHKIYGIEVGAAGNASIEKMIDAGDFGLGEWEVVESSEQAMLSQVDRAQKSKAAIVFLAWAPHPMNDRFDLSYLSGGDAYFGPNFGGAEVYTLARSGWTKMCPNAAALFRNLSFDIAMENALMGKILEGDDPMNAATAWLKEHPEMVESWLEGVTTFDGLPAQPAAKASLGQ